MKTFLYLERFNRLKDLPEGYEKVFRDAGQESIFITFPWFVNFTENVLKQDEDLKIYGVNEQGGNPRAFLLLRSPTKQNGPISPRKMKSLTNFYTSFFSPVISPGSVPLNEIIDTLVDGLVCDRREWDVLEFQPLDNGAENFRLMVESLKRVGLLVQTFFAFGNWYLDLDGRNYHEYFQSLPSYLRKKIPYKKRKLERRGKVEIKLVTDIDEVDAAIDDYEAIYNASWKKSEPYPNFIRSLAKIASKEGWLRLGTMYFNSKPVASQIWFVHNNIASIFKLSYMQEYSHLSVGTILTAYLMEYVIDEDEVVQVDYLTGDDSYKKDWMNKRRERWGIMAFNTQSLCGIFEAVKNVSGRKVKRIWRAVNHMSWEETLRKYVQSSGVYSSSRKGAEEGDRTLGELAL